MSDQVNLNIQEITKLLPHRYPFLLVDKVKSIDLLDKKIIAIKNVTFNEPHFTGHFPNYPVMPGVLIVEALAQAGGILAAKMLKETKENPSVLLTNIENAKFKRPVTPGDVVFLHVNIIVSKMMGANILYKFQGKAFVDDKLVSEANFGAVLTNK